MNEFMAEHECQTEKKLLALVFEIFTFFCFKKVHENNVNVKKQNLSFKSFFLKLIGDSYVFFYTEHEYVYFFYL